MIGKLTTYETLLPQAVDSQLELRKSASYLFNTEHVLEVVDETTYRRLVYKFNVYEDRTNELELLVTNTLAALVTLSDATLSSTKIAVSVFEGIQTFDRISSVTATTWYFNVRDIAWGEDDPTGAYSRIWIKTGGNKLTPYIVDHNVDQLIDLADTGATTTAS